MRKSLLFFVLALAVGLASNAEPVSVTAAGSRAAAFLGLRDVSQLELLKSPYESIYLFAIRDGGFVAVSADDRVQPILAYSLKSHLNVDNLPVNAAAWLEGYDRQIREVAKDASLPTHAEWLEQGPPKDGAEGYDSVVGPLLSTTWDQSPLYNSLCPLSRGTRTLTGCIATAMAQVMRYWNWPVTGVGQHSYTTAEFGTLSADFGATTYDWSNMPTALDTSSSAAEVAAVATLMYHCGVAVEMEYSILASGTSTNIMYNLGLGYPCPENALRTYFKYSPAITGVRRVDFTSGEWAALIKNEMDHRRPVLCSGVNPLMGHEFVCDGYDTNGFFHFNWGWSGDADGYFTFANLNPDGNNFNGSLQAIIAIEPDSLFGSGNTCTVVVTCSDTALGEVSGGGVYNYRDTVLLDARPTQGNRFLRWSNGSSVNPYPLLAHDVNYTAIFDDAFAEDGEIISYSGVNTSHTSMYNLIPSYRIGIKIPSSALSGRNYLSAIYFYTFLGKFVVYVHRGDDDAPGEVVYEQPFEVPNGDLRWYQVPFETPVPIDPNSNLWITIRTFQETSLLGASGLGIYDGSWFSNDDGNTWIHLNQCPELDVSTDSNVCWFIRCLTSPDSVVSQYISPTAFFFIPEQGNVGDTVMGAIVHSTSSTVEWNNSDADFFDVSSDTAFFVWNTEGMHTVSANVVGVNNSVTISNTILIADCGTPVNTFPYVIDFTGQDALLRACWQWFFHGTTSGYLTVNDHMFMYVASQTNNYYISPLIDLASHPNLQLELNYTSANNLLVTVELSQGGLDTADFTTIYTLPNGSNERPQPINLSEHNQGNPVRLALHMRRGEGRGDGAFNLYGLRITSHYEGIDQATDTPLAVSPNPARQAVNVTLPEPDGTLTLFDATGRQIIQRRTSSTQTTVDVSTLPQGVYLLQYTSPRGTSTTRFVVQ